MKHGGVSGHLACRWWEPTTFLLVEDEKVSKLNLNKSDEIRYIWKILEP